MGTLRESLIHSLRSAEKIAAEKARGCKRACGEVAAKWTDEAINRCTKVDLLVVALLRVG